MKRMMNGLGCALMVTGMIAAASARADTTTTVVDGVFAPIDPHPLPPRIVKIGKSYKSGAGTVRIYKPKVAGHYRPKTYSSVSQTVSPLRVHVVNPYTATRVRSIANAKARKYVQGTPGLKKAYKTVDAVKRAREIQQQLMGGNASGQAIRIH